MVEINLLSPSNFLQLSEQYNKIIRQSQTIFTLMKNFKPANPLNQLTSQEKEQFSNIKSKFISLQSLIFDLEPIISNLIKLRYSEQAFCSAKLSQLKNNFTETQNLFNTLFQWFDESMTQGKSKKSDWNFFWRLLLTPMNEMLNLLSYGSDPFATNVHNLAAHYVNEVNEKFEIDVLGRTRH